MDGDDQEKSSFKWKSFSDHLREIMRELMTSGSFKDVILFSEDQKQIQAHRNILSSCSPVFKTIFSQDTSNSQHTVYLKGMRYSEIEAIVQFIYTGQVTIDLEKVNDFIDSAKSLEVICLKDIKAEDDPGEVKSEKEMEYESKSEEINIETDCKESLTTGENKVVLKGKELTEYILQRFPVDKKLPRGSLLSLSLEERKERRRVRERYRSSLIRAKVALDPPPQVMCDQCEKSYSSIEQLRRHTRIVHENIKYTCDKCSRSFGRKVHLKIHYESIHEGRRFDCDLCDYKATQKYNLITHKKIKHNIIKLEGLKEGVNE